MKTTRYPNGVTNVAANSILGAYGAPDPTRFHEFFDDFDRFVAADWTITKTGTGTTALFAEDGGVLQARRHGFVRELAEPGDTRR